MAIERSELKRVVAEVINNTEYAGKQLRASRFAPESVLLSDQGMLLTRVEGLAWQIHHLAKVVEQLVESLDG